jgi:uncharacterized protein
MSIDAIKAAVTELARRYPVSRITLFGSRAGGTNREDSDVDLIIEFTAPVTLITLAAIKNELEEALSLDVDVIHGPIRDDDMIEIGKRVVLYAA